MRLCLCLLHHVLFFSLSPKVLLMQESVRRIIEAEESRMGRNFEKSMCDSFRAVHAVFLDEIGPFSLNSLFRQAICSFGRCSNLSKVQLDQHWSFQRLHSGLGVLVARTRCGNCDLSWDKRGECNGTSLFLSTCLMDITKRSPAFGLPFNARQLLK